MDEKEFLLLIRDKVDLLIPKISLNTPLIEISAMIAERLKELERKESGPDLMIATSKPLKDSPESGR